MKGKKQESISRRRKEMWRRYVSLLVAMVLVMGNVMPAISEGIEPVCGKAEHTHEKECYTQVKELICGSDETEGHVHGAECLGTKQNLICQTEVSEGHQHDNTCYTPTPKLNCGLEENAGHQHNENCPTITNTTLVCTLTENDGHVHEESCYEAVEQLTCTSTEEGHEHTKECYAMVRTENLICGKEAGADAHSHDANACYTSETVVNCEIPVGEGAHTHTDACYINEDILTCTKAVGEGAHEHGEGCYETVNEYICGKAPNEGAHKHEDACYEVKEILECTEEEHTHDGTCYPSEETEVQPVNEEPAVNEDAAENNKTEETEAPRIGEAVYMGKYIENITLESRQIGTDVWNLLANKVTEKAEGLFAEETDELKLTVEFKIPGGTLIGTTAVDYKLPLKSNEAVYQNKEEIVYALDKVTAIGKAVTATDGTVTITFDEEYLKANDNGTELNGTYAFVANAGGLVYDAENKAEVRFQEEELNPQVAAVALSFEKKVKETDAPVIESNAEETDAPTSESDAEETDAPTSESDAEETDAPTSESNAEETDAPTSESDAEETDAPTSESDAEETDAQVVENVVAFQSDEGANVLVDGVDVTNATAMAKNGTIYFEVQVAKGYELVSVIVDNKIDARFSDRKPGEYIIENIQTNATIVAVTTKIPETNADQNETDAAQPETPETTPVQNETPITDLSGRQDDLEVYANFAEGVVPNDTRLEVSKIADTTTISQTIENKLAENGQNAKAIHPFDITFTDYEKNEIAVNGEVNIRIIPETPITKNDSANTWAVYHINTEGVAEEVANVTYEYADDSGNAINAFSFTANEFSPYVLVEAVRENVVTFQSGDGTKIFVKDIDVADNNNAAMAENGTIYFTVAVEEGYELVEVIVDNTTVITPDETTGEYRISNIQTDKTIVTVSAITKLQSQSMIGEITVTCEEGTVEKGTQLEVKDEVPNQENVNQAIEEKLAENYEETANVRPFDISLTDEKGKAAEVSGEVTVNVTLAEPVSKEEAEEIGVEVYQVTDAGDAEEVKDITYNEEVNGEETTITGFSFTTEEPAPYVFVEKNTITVDYLTDEGETYEISVNISGTTNIPASAKLAVKELTDAEYEEYVAKVTEAIGGDNGQILFTKLFDITIMDGENEIQPDENVTVEIKLKDEVFPEMQEAQVVHFGETTELLNANMEENTVKFEASGFSIYAIVGTGNNARLIYEFYNGDELITKEYVKKYEVTNNGVTETKYESLYDPGLVPEYGQRFVGWSYIPNDTVENAMNIADLNADCLEKLQNEYTDGDTTKVYAVLEEAYYLRYMNMDEAGNVTVLRTIVVPKNGSSTDRTVTINYQVDLSEGEIYQGWYDPVEPRNYSVQLYTSSFATYDTIVLDRHLDLYLKLNNRNWLVFDSNKGTGSSSVTYTPPQLLFTNDVTVMPDDPIRKGYTFKGWNTKADGTGDDWGGNTTNNNNFGGNLTEDMILYAQWEASDAEYHVVFWKQSASDTVGLADNEKSYDYVSSAPRTAKTDETVTLTTDDTKKGDSTSSEYGYYFTYNANNSDTSAVVNADGTTTLNVYYDRKTITYIFNGSHYTYTEGTGSDASYGFVDGSYVKLTNNNDTWTYETGEYNESYTETNSTSNNIKQYALIDGEYIELTREKYGSSYRWYYYEGWSKRYWTEERYILTQTPITETYNGTRYVRTTETSRSFSGLYGSAFNDWPTPQDGTVWTTGSIRFPLPLTEFNPYATVNGSDQASITKTTITWSSTNYNTSATLTIYKMTTEGEWEYTSDWILATANLNGGSGNTWYPTETFTGFEVDAYCKSGTINSNSTWTTVTSSGSISYSSSFALRYRRNQHNINFISGGNHVTSQSTVTTAPIYYEAGISSYTVDGKKYTVTGADGTGGYIPTNGEEGYFFDGWYEDETCQVPFNFSDTSKTMPDHDITVYAKWSTYRVRTVLIPTKDNLYNDEVYIPNNQALSFRLDYNEKVSNTNITSDVMTRTGYKLIGWYTSPAFEESSLWNFNTQVNGKVQGVNMKYQESADWTNNIYKDNPDSNGKVRDEVWGILKLYAKWQLDIVDGAIYIEYEVPEQYVKRDSDGNLLTTIPQDLNAYVLPETGNINAILGEAPTNYVDGFKFKHWVLLDSNGNETSISEMPGNPWTIDDSYIKEIELTDDYGTTKTMKVITFRAAFEVDENNIATTVTFDGNGGTNTASQASSITQSWQVNQDFEMLGEGSFERSGYTLLGWAFNPNMTAAEYQAAIAAGSDEVFALNARVAADNLDRTELNDKDNTVYAVWAGKPYTVTVKKVVSSSIAGDKNMDFEFTPSFTGLSGEYSTEFKLKDQAEKIFGSLAEDSTGDVLCGSTFKITETVVNGFEGTVEATYVDEAGNTQTLTPNTNGWYTVPAGNVTVTFTNTRQYTNVKIIKVLTDSTTNNEAKEFEFTASYSCNGITTDLKNFKVVSGNKAYTLENLPVGATLTVSEIGVDEYTTTVQPSGSEISNGSSCSLSVPADGTLITFTNTRKTTSITLKKVAEGTDTLLSGAKFKLTHKTGDEYVTNELIPATKADVVHELAGGTLTIDGLPSGDYKLTEIKSPDGYLILSEDIYFTVNATGEGNVIVATEGMGAFEAIRVKTEGEDNDTLVIPNTAGKELPATGSTGTTSYTIGGLLTILAASIFLVYNNKKRRKEGM